MCKVGFLRLDTMIKGTKMFKKVIAAICVMGATSGTGHAVTLNGTKINSVGTWAAGAAVPQWLAVANTIGGFASKWGGALSIGATLAAAVLSDYQNPPQTLTLLPRRNVKTGQLGSGWSDADTPPATASKTGQCSNSGAVGAVASGQGDTASSCFYSLKAAFEAANPGFTMEAQDVQDNYVGWYEKRDSDGCYYYYGYGYCLGQATLFTMNMSWTCPTGYALVNNVCTLNEPALSQRTNSNAAQWQADGSPSYYADSGTNTFKSHYRDPDNVGNTWAGTGTASTSRTGTDPVGNPTKETVILDSTGNTTITQDQQGVTSDGAQAVNRNSMTYNSAGVVTSVTNQTFYNSTINNMQSSPTDVSALAKDATLQQTNTKLDQINQKLTKDSTPLPEIPESKSFRESTDDFVNTIKAGPLAGLIGMNLSDGGDCPTWTVSIGFLHQDYDITQFCDMAPYFC